MATELATAYVSLVPTTKGIQQHISKEIGAPLEHAGREAGEHAGHEYGEKFREHAKEGIKRVAEFGKQALELVGIAGAAEFVKAGLDKTMEASRAQAQLAAGIKSTHDAAHVTVGQMKELAHSIQDYSGQTEESIQKAQGLLLTFTNIRNRGPKKVFDEATTAAANLAARFGGDASSQAIKLGKALNDPVKGLGALSRVGIKFTDSQKASIAAMVKHGHIAEAQEVILKKLNTSFGGAAKAAGSSLPGQLTRAKLALEDMAGEVMGNAVPAIRWLAGAVEKYVVPAIKQAVEFVKEHWPEISERINRLKPILIAVFQRVLVPAFRDAVAAFHSLVKAGKNIWAVIAPLVQSLAKYVGVALVVAFRAAATGGRQIAAVLAVVAKWMKDHATLVRAVVVGIAAAVAVWKIWTTAIKVWTLVTKVAAAAQKLFSGAMDANPIMLVIMAIAALAAGLIYAYQHSATFRRIVQAAFKAVKTVVLDVVNWFKGPFVNFFTKTIPNAFRSMARWISQVFGNVVGFLKTWGPVALAVLFPFLGIPLVIFQHFSQIKHFLGQVWSDAIGGIKGFISHALSWIGGLPGRIANFGGQMVQAGAHLIGRLWDGLKSLGSSAGSFVANIVGDIGSGIKNILNDVLNLPWVLPHFRIGAFGHYINIGGETLFPRLAQGGLTTGPTVAMVGDNPSGHELVMPLDSSRTVSLLSKAMENAGGGSKVIGGRLEITPDSAGRLRAWVRGVILDEADIAATHARMGR